jgi:tetratricopeptide (TPR) repeat protein
LARPRESTWTASRRLGSLHLVKRFVHPGQQRQFTSEGCCRDWRARTPGFVPLYYARRFDEAAAQFLKAVELESNWDQLYFGLGLTLVQQGRYEDAIAALRTAAQMSPDNPLLQASLVYGLARAGFSHEANEGLEKLTANHAYVPSWFLSLVWVGLNEKERAFESLEDAFRAHEPCLVSLKVDPVFDPLRDDARFADMVRRVGLEP